MALSAKLELRQGQALVMTPQLQQAIKLLQFSNLELSEYVEGELERNPLLEYSERSDEPAAIEREHARDQNAENAQDKQEAALDLPQDLGTSDPTTELDSDFDNVFQEAAQEKTAQPEQSEQDWDMVSPGGNISSNDSLSSSPLSSSSLVGSSLSGHNGTAGEDNNLEAYVSEQQSLHDHLNTQLALAFESPSEKMIGQHLVDMVDESGYLQGNINNLSDRLNAPIELVESVLQKVQSFDPPGVFARDLKECLALQLKEQNRFDPAIECLLDHLHLLASHDFEGLARACAAHADDLEDMIAEIKNLNPKPGLKFGFVTMQPVVPDVLVRKRADGAWHVELNSDTLPKVLVNQNYYTTVSKTAKSEQDKTYLSECLQTANWLVKSLDQRAKTILKVSEEIVRQQDGFLTHGVQHLRPLNLKTVAEAISMHESTVSRVTSNKYMATSRGIFELKYFFTSAISSSSFGEEAYSSEAVRYRIKQMIDHEPPNKVLSDDKIVERLRGDGIDIARRTVAKYREALHIPSSVQRRREKKMLIKS